MGDVKHPYPVEVPWQVNPNLYISFPPPCPTQPIFSLWLPKWVGTAGEGCEGARASFAVHSFEELSWNLDWKHRPSSMRG